MNEFLADMYGTREAIGAPSEDTDVEKLAEAQLLDEALQAEGIDIDQLPGDTILKLAYQILGEDSYLVKAAMDESEEDEEEAPPKEPKKDAEEGEETMEEKVAQADFLGRVMAHSYVNELDDIEKNALSLGQAGQAVKNWGQLGGHYAGKAGKAVAGGAKAGYEGAKRNVKDVGEGFKGLGHMAKSPIEAGKALKQSLKEQGVKGTLKGNVKELKALGVGAAGVGGAGYGASKAFGGKKKKASAIEALAEKRAMEWAEAVGLVENDESEKLAAAVNERAYEMLLENGIDVDAIEASLE